MSRRAYQHRRFVEVTETGISVDLDPDELPIVLPNDMFAANSVSVHHLDSEQPGAAKMTLTMMCDSLHIKSTPKLFWARSPEQTFAIDVAHIERQREFSERTFGPGVRTAGVLDHLAKELKEIREAPHDVSEWADLIILAIDGAWRSGATPEEIIAAVKAKQSVNEARQWPDWRTADPDKAIEHVRDGAVQ